MGEVGGGDARTPRKDMGMRIYTRQEIGLRPPRYPVHGGYQKQYFVIHNTASPNYGPGRTFEQDASMVRMWQDYQMRTYPAAKDILENFHVMQSGRLLEGRMPLDSDGGAAYNAGGIGFGIECEGNWEGGGAMSDLQYRSLVWLCAWVSTQIEIPLEFVGHRQIPGNDTACPGVLIQQFGLGLGQNGRLKRDVVALLAAGLPDVPPEHEQEGDEEGMEIVETMRRFPAYNDGGKANCGFDITDESEDGKGARVRLFFRRNDGDKGYPPPDFGDKWTFDLLPEGSRYIDVRRDFGVVGSITVKVEVLARGPVGVTRRQTL